jgi:hypothetical protein
MLTEMESDKWFMVDWEDGVKCKNFEEMKGGGS